uniref:Helicase C-terminal domain-containing protein n=1 Tax=viral metagenome TaxID=1070528 RepID=A0A6C0J9F0_9ZZZZ
MEQKTKKVKLVKRKKRLLNNKQRVIDLEKIILGFKELETVDKIIEKSEQIVDELDEEEDLVKRIELELQLEGLKYVLEDIGYAENNIKDKSYPIVGDSNFSLKIARKREFNQYKINNEEWNSKNLEDISKKCSWNDLSQSQKFLQNFISPMTPYNGLLLFHGVGVGKTCSSITIAEGFKDYLEEKKKKVYVLLKPTIRENYKRSIIDLNKINEGDDNQCTGDNYFEEMGKSFVGKKIKKKEDLKKMEKKANKIINRYYDFYGYGEFVNIYKEIDNSIKVKDDKERLIILQKRLREKFSDSVIIIDEVHNITPRDKSYNENIDKSKKSKKNNKNNKRGGGNYNDFTEGLTLTQGEKDGKEVSGVLMKIIQMVENMKLVLLSATPMYNEATEIVYLLNLLLANDKKPLLNTSKIFNNGKITEEGKRILRKKTPGYVSYLRSENPINYPYKLEPEGVDIIKPEGLPNMDMKGNIIPADKRIKHLSFIACPMSSLQYEVYKKYFDFNETQVNAFDTVGSQICNITYNEDINLKMEDIEDVGGFYSDKGFKKILKTLKNKYKFENNNVKDYFTLSNLEKVAPKIAKIVSNVNKSYGINFVYSQFKNSGVFPIAFALEMEGYVNYDGTRLLDLPKDHPKKLIEGKQARYLIITGESSVDFNNYKKEKEGINMDGGELKVILGTQAAGEGLNIFNVRGIHILDPWHHLNRLEQIVGRGLRSCSHKNLPLEERNLMVFLYIVTYPDNHKETLDIKMYRKAEEKTLNVAEVQRELKILAVDCHLNKEGNVYLGEKWETPIDVKDLFGKKKKITIGDKAGSKICNYMDDCNYECYGGELGEEVNDSTYTLDFSKYDVKSVIKILKNYFREIRKVKSTFNEIFNFIKVKNQNISKTILSKALYNIIEKEIIVNDRLNRKGTIIYRGNEYIFQPVGLSNTVTMIERRIPFKTRKKKLGLEKILEKSINSKKVKNNITHIPSEEVARYFKENVQTYIKKLNINEKSNDLIIVIAEVYDRLEYKNKNIILKYILEKIIVMGELETYNFDNIYGVFNFEGMVEKIILSFKDEETYILSNIFDYILKNKIYLINGILGFKINYKNEMKYFKLNDKKLIELNGTELIDVKSEYVNRLKDIKTIDKTLSDLYGFITEDKKGNIIFKILDKKKGITKTTQQSTGSNCSHFKLPELKVLLSKFRSDIPVIKGKGDFCDNISFYMRKQNIENTDNLIYFYGLDEYLELK